MLMTLADFNALKAENEALGQKIEGLNTDFLEGQLGWVSGPEEVGRLDDYVKELHQAFKMMRTCMRNLEEMVNLLNDGKADQAKGSV